MDERGEFSLRSDVITYLKAILRECHYHLDSLLVMADVMSNQDEHRTARDLIGKSSHLIASVGQGKRNLLKNTTHKAIVRL